MQRFDLKILRTVFLIATLIVCNCYAAVYPYYNNGKIVGRVQYAVVKDDNESLHHIARQYQVGYDALILANPHLDPKASPQPGTVIYLPNAIIVPALNPNEVVVNVAEKRMFYLDGKTKKLYIWPVGIGRSHTPTPLGKMSIIQKRSNPTWYVPKDALEEAYRAGYHDHPKIMPPSPGNPLGRHAISLSKRSYLIHGTHDAKLIGTMNTSGCINMYPEDIAQLYSMLSVNDKVVIINEPVKSHITSDAIFIEAHPNLSGYDNDDIMDQIIQDYHHHIAEEALAKNFSGNNSTSIDNVAALLDNPLGVPTIISQ